MADALNTAIAATPFTDPWKGDNVGRGSLAISIFLHVILIISVLGWDIFVSWLNAQTPPDEPITTAPVSRLVYAPPPTSSPAIKPELVPSLTTLPDQPSALPPAAASAPLRPLLNKQRPLGAGAGNDGRQGDNLETPQLPPAMALPLAPAPQPGGGQRNIPLQQRQEQEANYILMGLLLRQYREQWKPIYGERLPRRTFYLWIKHDNSRVVAAQFANGSSSGIESLDRLILGWLVESNKIDLSRLTHSQSELMMSVDLYQAHR